MLFRFPTSYDKYRERIISKTNIFQQLRFIEMSILACYKHFKSLGKHLGFLAFAFLRESIETNVSKNVEYF